MTCKNRFPYNLYCVGGDVNTAHSLIRRQNSRYFRCPVWKTKSW